MGNVPDRKENLILFFFQYCENVTDGHKLPYLLIMPVQRIPRYTLLLTVSRPLLEFQCRVEGS